MRTADDLPAAAAALVEVHSKDGYPVEGVDDPVAWLTGPRVRRAWVGELNGSVVGHVSVSAPQPGDAAVEVWTSSAEGASDTVGVLSRLFVLPAARGRSLGEKLVHAAASYAQQAHRRLVLDVLTKDAATIRLYERLGWRRIGTTMHGLRPRPRARLLLRQPQLAPATSLRPRG